MINLALLVIELLQLVFDEKKNKFYILSKEYKKLKV